MHYSTIKNTFLIIGGLLVLLGVMMTGSAINPSYSNVNLLPIGFGIFLILTASMYFHLKQYLMFWVITIQQIVRYAIIPVLFLVDNNLVFGAYTDNSSYAVFMMLVELLILLIIYFFWTSKNVDKKIDRKVNLTFLKISLVNNLIFVGFIAILLLNRSFFDKVSFIWDFSKYLQLRLEGNVEEISPTISIMFPVIRTYIILYLFSVIDSFRIAQGKKLLLSILILMFNATIIVGTSRFSIVYASLPLILLLIHLYPTYRRKLISYSTAVFGIVIMISSVSKYSREDQIVGIGDFFSIYQLNAYFGGNVNYALGYDAYESNNVKLEERKNYLVSDIFQNVPILSKIADENYKTNVLFNNHIYGRNGSRDQIVPISVAGLFHFSIYFFFFYIAIFSYLAFVFERRAYRQKSIVLFYLFIILGFACATNMMINIGSLIATLFINLIVFIPFFQFINKINYSK